MSKNDLSISKGLYNFFRLLRYFRAQAVLTISSAYNGHSQPNSRHGAEGCFQWLCPGPSGRRGPESTVLLLQARGATDLSSRPGTPREEPEKSPHFFLLSLNFSLSLCYASETEHTAYFMRAVTQSTRGCQWQTSLTTGSLF